MHLPHVVRLPPKEGSWNPRPDWMLPPEDLPRRIREADEELDGAQNSHSAVGRWLRRSVPGFCNLTSQVGDCEFSTMGSWPIPPSAQRDNTSRLTWDEAVTFCLDQCSQCNNCAVISLSRAYRDCSWYSGTQRGTCDLAQGSEGLQHHKAVVDVRSAPMPVRRRPVRERTCLQARGADAETARLIDLPDLDCDERYFSHVTCAGSRFLFSRREFSCCDM